MFIYNITIKINNAILHDWMKWQTEEHIPEIMATKLFELYMIFHLLEEDESDGTTYVFQYHTSSKNNYLQYVREFAPALRDKAIKRWGNGFIAFRSLLESVQ